MGVLNSFSMAIGINGNDNETKKNLMKILKVWNEKKSSKFILNLPKKMTNGIFNLPNFTLTSPLPLYNVFSGFLNYNTNHGLQKIVSLSAVGDKFFFVSFNINRTRGDFLFIKFFFVITLDMCADRLQPERKLAWNITVKYLTLKPYANSFMFLRSIVDGVSLNVL